MNNNNPYLDIDQQMAGDIYTSSEVMDNLTVLCDDFGARFAGTPEEQQAAKFIVDTFERYGLKLILMQAGRVVKPHLRSLSQSTNRLSAYPYLTVQHQRSRANWYRWVMVHLKITNVWHQTSKSRSFWSVVPHLQIWEDGFIVKRNMNAQF